jgi:hypothetical protein
MIAFHSIYIRLATTSDRWLYVACMGEMRNVYEILDRNPEGKRPIERPRHRGKDILKCILGKQV